MDRIVRPLAFAVVALLVVARAGAAQGGTAPRDSLALARRFAEWFFTGQKDSLWAHTDSAFRTRLTNADGWLSPLEELTARAGSEVKVLEERFIKRGGFTQYWRIATYSGSPEPVVLRFAVARNWTLIGLGMNPLSAAPPVDTSTTGARRD